MVKVNRMVPLLVLWGMEVMERFFAPIGLLSKVVLPFLLSMSLPLRQNYSSSFMMLNLLRGLNGFVFG